MDLYTSTSYELSRALTLRYSTSFGKSSELFSADIRPHIFAIYGLVRIADEIVDTYQGKNAEELLAALEEDTYATLDAGYSTNPIIHAFAQTAVNYGITRQLIAPFFESMRMDLTKKSFNKDEYARYIYGSAEVIGLMCLRVFVDGDTSRYDTLKQAAQALGVAYQKVNFLRDIASDQTERGRMYFPNMTFDALDEQAKTAIVGDIKEDFERAYPAVNELPLGARRAVGTSYLYYNELLRQLEKAPIQEIKTRRVRVNDAKKFLIGLKATAGVFK